MRTEELPVLTVKFSQFRLLLYGISRDVHRICLLSMDMYGLAYSIASEKQEEVRVQLICFLYQQMPWCF